MSLTLKLKELFGYSFGFCFSEKPTFEYYEPFFYDMEIHSGFTFGWVTFSWSRDVTYEDFCPETVI